jgi:predicted nucleic acid-binding protein
MGIFWPQGIAHSFVTEHLRRVLLIEGETRGSWFQLHSPESNHTSLSGENTSPIVAALPVIPYTEQTAHEHARLWADLQAAGRMIGAYDLIVAATTLERGSHLATFNTRHFSLVKGLRVIEPKIT